MSSQSNAFEEALDFSFCREICEKHGTLSHFIRGEYFAHTEEVLKKAGWMKVPVNKSNMSIYEITLSQTCVSFNSEHFYSCLQ